jgi:prephenate dehydrogenase
MSSTSLATQRIGIVGLGLMGGSLALALRGRCRSIVAIEPQPGVRQQALRAGIVTEATDELAAGVTEVDLLVFATPVRTTVDLLAQLPALRPDGCLVTDLGSTKAAVVAAMDDLPLAFAAIGGHPMCGKETSGLASADGDLYRDRTFVLCRSRRTTLAAEETALALVAAVGARPVFLPAAEHDALVAAVSHLPYAAAAALMRLVTDEAAWEISASGFRDVSRLAGSDTRMMLDILMTNRPAILAALRDYQAELATLTVLLEAGDEPQLSEWVAAARVRHAAYRRHLSARPPGEEGVKDGDPG